MKMVCGMSTTDKLQGLKVFVVEDEAIIAMMLEDMLSDLGCNVIGPCTGLKQAHEMLAGAETPNVAILDVNVGGEQVYPVATALKERGVPLVFATGYGSVGLAEVWRACVTVQKPYTQDDIVRALGMAVGA